MPSLAELQKKYSDFKTVIHRKPNPEIQNFGDIIFLFLTGNLILMKLDEIPTLILYFRDFFGAQKGNVGVGSVGETMLYLKH